MNVVIYTNCQGDELKKYLVMSPEFNREYRINLVFKPHLYNDSSLENGGVNQTKSLPSILLENLKNSDVFIHQPFSSRRGIFSTEGEDSVIKYLKDSCKVTTFPSLYADIFPIYTEGKYIKGLKNIEDLLISGHNKSDILEMLDSGLINFYLKDRLDFSLEFMEKKENVCNIKASQFIQENIKNFRLFDTQNHPTEILMSFISNKIFEDLGIDFRFDIFNMERYVINGVGLPDSSYMYNEIGLSYIDKNVIGEYYSSLITKYLDSPASFLLLDKNKTCYQ